jgi:hypothetical protein
MPGADGGSPEDSLSSEEPARSGPDRLRVLLVANVLTHYRLPLYEELQRHVDLELAFFSNGPEWSGSEPRSRPARPWSTHAGSEVGGSAGPGSRPACSRSCGARLRMSSSRT